MQSAFDPASAQAERILELFWVMAGGGLLIWLAMIGLTLYAIRANPEHRTLRRDRFMIVGGGVVVPTIILTSLLMYGLAPIPDLLAPPPEGSLQVTVTGEQWWWRVPIHPPGRESVQLANEIRLPVGEPVEFQLESPDVIHSFWIPSLGGKVDMIPGRSDTAYSEANANRFVSWSLCRVLRHVSRIHELFRRRYRRRRNSRAGSQSRQSPPKLQRIHSAIRGQELFVANGCGACHTMRGTPADGVVGPDLTHVGSRFRLGRGQAARTTPNPFDRWISATRPVETRCSDATFPYAAAGRPATP